MVAYEFTKFLKRNSIDIFHYEKLERSFYEFVNDNSLDLYESINIKKLIEYSVCIM